MFPDEDETMSSGMTAEEDILTQMSDVVAELQAAKPNDRSERDRRWAIVITEMEKVRAIAKEFLK